MKSPKTKPVKQGQQGRSIGETVPHLIDMTEPDATWKGYWCPVDQKFHKDGTTMFMNQHCIACAAMLTKEWKRGQR